MNTEPELLNERLKRLAIVLDEIMPHCALLVRDAIALLEEHEPVEPVHDKQNIRIWLCGNCGCFVGLANYLEFDKFCRKCGHPVKWQDKTFVTNNLLNN